MLNDGNDTFDHELFDNIYQSDDQKGKKRFLLLWLHAFEYTYKDLTITTESPLWV